MTATKSSTTNHQPSSSSTPVSAAEADAMATNRSPVIRQSVASCRSRCGLVPGMPATRLCHDREPGFCRVVEQANRYDNPACVPEVLDRRCRRLSDSEGPLEIVDRRSGLRAENEHDPKFAAAALPGQPLDGFRLRRT